MAFSVASRTSTALHTGNGGDGLLHVLGAIGAVHAEDGEFDRLVEGHATLVVRSTRVHSYTPRATSASTSSPSVNSPSTRSSLSA